MYVSYFEYQESSMYPECKKYSNGNLPLQNFPVSPHYSNYMGYHNVHSVDNHGHPSSLWENNYGMAVDEYSYYGPGISGTSSPPVISGLSNGQTRYDSQDFRDVYHSGSGEVPVSTVNTQPSANNQRLQPCEWAKKAMHTNPAGKTRTREKYRVVYTDHQRLQLEKEFLSNRYITIRRKSEIALNLGLSDRQVKIWFQNRRAKERKLIKKAGQHDGGMCSVQRDSGSVSPAHMTAMLYPQSHAMGGGRSVDSVPHVTVSQ
ncbi:homeobox protein CDX-1-like [Bufo gargarizans]|uniref:homeobox protein CDX-1-like n=1 Tax=Bufo gargarizans TaxID=30331 RepID=UPI001CF4DBE3|nr:homeobox protein CDX-1-like [Bufo gargarizans]